MNKVTLVFEFSDFFSYLFLLFDFFVLFFCFVLFFECTKNEVFKYSKRMPRNMEKKLNTEDKCMYYL